MKYLANSCNREARNEFYTICILCSVQCIISAYNVHCTMCKCALYTVHCTMYSVHYILAMIDG